MQNSMKFSSDIFHDIHISLNPFEICVNPACSAGFSSEGAVGCIFELL